MSSKQGHLDIDDFDKLSRQICECQERILMILARGAPRIDVQLPKLHPRLFDPDQLRSEAAGAGGQAAYREYGEDPFRERHSSEREPLMDGASIDNIGAGLSLSLSHTAAVAASSSSSAPPSSTPNVRRAWPSPYASTAAARTTAAAAAAASASLRGRRWHCQDGAESDEEEEEEEEEAEGVNFNGDDEEFQGWTKEVEEQLLLTPTLPKRLPDAAAFPHGMLQTYLDPPPLKLHKGSKTEPPKSLFDKVTSPGSGSSCATFVFSLLLTAFLETYQFQPEHGLPVVAAATCTVCFLGLTSSWLLVANNLHSMLSVIFEEVVKASGSLMEQALAAVCEPAETLEEAYQCLRQCQAELTSILSSSTSSSELQLQPPQRQRQPPTRDGRGGGGGIVTSAAASEALKAFPSDASLRSLSEPLGSCRRLLEASLDDARASAPAVIEEAVQENELGEIATSRQVFLVKIVVTPLALSLLLNALVAALEANWLVGVAKWHGAVPSLTFFSEEDDPDRTPNASGVQPTRMRSWVAVSLYFLVPLLQNALTLTELLALSAWFGKRRLGIRINKALVAIQRDFSLQIDAGIATTADHVFHSVFGEMRVASAAAFAKQTKALEQLRSALLQEERDDAAWETLEANVPSHSPTSAGDFELI
eukprot:CAMPEP_0206578738 /NCGR_PEP_ID=MMETSP0325_2-20121206/32140_1 /ASSEMBLY_ACC=CAM_ASM_000347 /TAXON_ID=2866 /ORGANISM="Crypthecodinium cohnii, Strain Seligo" /LENGTH=648 /DNA_ID=CAMNT_0054084431 /DNA_START=84 /DNA_END=2030 /DNA_ORIENTATION=+